jgi:hypothetical protein
MKISQVLALCIAILVNFGCNNSVKIMESESEKSNLKTLSIDEKMFGSWLVQSPEDRMGRIYTFSKSQKPLTPDHKYQLTISGRNEQEYIWHIALLTNNGKNYISWAMLVRKNDEINISSDGQTLTLTNPHYATVTLKRMN